MGASGLQSTGVLDPAQQQRLGRWSVLLAHTNFVLRDRPVDWSPTSLDRIDPKRLRRPFEWDASDGRTLLSCWLRTSCRGKRRWARAGTYPSECRSLLKNKISPVHFSFLHVNHSAVLGLDLLFLVVALTNNVPVPLCLFHLDGARRYGRLSTGHEAVEDLFRGRLVDLRFVARPDHDAALVV